VDDAELHNLAGSFIPIFGPGDFGMVYSRSPPCYLFSADYKKPVTRGKIKRRALLASFLLLFVIILGEVNFFMKLT